MLSINSSYSMPRDREIALSRQTNAKFRQIIQSYSVYLNRKVNADFDSSSDS
ncbi:MAG: hypothetical protein WC667_11785 [Sulfurimonas sp.]